MSHSKKKTLPPPSDTDVRAALNTVIEGNVEAGLNAVFLDPEHQKRLVTYICDEAELQGAARVIVRISVNLLGRLCVAGGNRLSGRLKQALQDRLVRLIGRLPGAQRVLAAFTSALTNVEAIKAAEHQVETLTQTLMDETIALGEGVGLDLRIDIAILDALRLLRDEQGDITEWITAQNLPKFKNHLIKANEKNQFYFGSQAIPFIPRTHTVKALDAFLDLDTQFQWAVVHGPGGSGKSRLALEFSLARSGGWTTGFLDQNTPQPQWRTWRPQTPHLLIIDYPSSAPEQVAAMLRALSDAAANKTLEAPVRVLLLEREAQGQWRQTLLQGEGAREHICAHETEFAPLEPLKDLWAIYTHFFDKAQIAHPNKDETLDALKRIDPETRPLYAAFHAHALSWGEAGTHWDRNSLVRYVLEYDETHYWRVSVPGDLSPWKRLAALVTLCEGLSIEGVRSLCDAFPDHLPPYGWDTTRHSLIAICGPLVDGRFSPLQPDILGELFLLDQLIEMRDDPQTLEAMINACSVHRGSMLGVLGVLYRAEADFGDHPAFKEIDVLKHYQPVFQLFRSTLEPVLRDPITTWTTKLLPLLATAAPNPFTVFIYGGVINIFAKTVLRTADERQAALDLQKRLAEHASAPTQREESAKATANLISHLGEMDAEAAQDLYMQLTQLSEDHPEEPALREWQAKAACNLIVAMSYSDPQSARTLYHTEKEVLWDVLPQEYLGALESDLGL